MRKLSWESSGSGNQYRRVLMDRAQFSEGQAGLEVEIPPGLRRTNPYVCKAAGGPQSRQGRPYIYPLGKTDWLPRMSHDLLEWSMVGRKRGGTLHLPMRAAATGEQLPKNKES